MVNGNAKRNGQAKKKPTNKKNGNGNNMGFAMTSAPRMPVPIMQAGSNYRPDQPNLSKLSGSDFVTTLVTLPNPTTSASRILAKIPVSPSAFPGTRITQLSQLWERYRFVKFTVRYVPAVPMTLACQYLIYIDTDPLDDAFDIINQEALLRQATAQSRSQQFNFNVSKTIDLAMRKDDQMYYTGADKQNLRFSQQGVVYILQVTDLVDFNGDVVSAPIETGSVYIDWAVCFGIPQINPSSLSATGIVGTGGTPPAVFGCALQSINFTGTTFVSTPLQPLRQYYIVPCLTNGSVAPTATRTLSSSNAGSIGTITAGQSFFNGVILVTTDTGGRISLTTNAAFGNGYNVWIVPT